MTELNKLFAIKIMLQSLNYSDSKIKPLIEEIDKLICFEFNLCTPEYSDRLKQLDSLIEKNL